MEREECSHNGADTSIHQNSLRGPHILAKMIKDALEKDRHVSTLYQYASSIIVPVLHVESNTTYIS